MKVAEVFIKYPPAIGGHERYVELLSRSLVYRGIEVSVFCSRLRNHINGEFIDNSNERSFERLNGVPVHRLPAEIPVTRAIRIRGLTRALIEYAPDVIHAHDIWRDSTRCAIDAAKQLGVPIIINVLYHDRSREPQATRWHHELEKTLSSLPDNSLLLFNTPWELNKMHERGHNITKFDYLPPAIDINEIDAIGHAQLSQLDDPGLIVLLFVGRMTREKGVEDLLDSFRSMLESRQAGNPAFADRLRLVIAGYRDGYVDYPQVCEQVNYGRQVTFFPDAPREIIINLMRRADIFLLPSRVETFGIVVLEAWHTGNLVIVSDQAALPYVVTHEFNGLVCENSQLQRVIEASLETTGSRKTQKMIENGRKSIFPDHTANRQAENFIQLAEKLLAEHAGKGES